MTDAPKTLAQAAQAVLDRWDSPQWKWLKEGPTADLMNEMRRALAAQEQAEPFGYFRCHIDGWENCAETDEGARALYEHPPAAQLATAQQIDAMRAALEVTLGNIMSLGPAGALASVPTPYRVWAQVVAEALGQEGSAA